MNLIQRNDFVKLNKECEREYPHLIGIVGRVIFVDKQNIEIIFKSHSTHYQNLQFCELHYSKLDLLARTKRNRKIDLLLNG